MQLFKFNCKIAIANEQFYSTLENIGAKTVAEARN